VRIAFELQLRRNDEYVTLRNARQTHEDETRCHNGSATYLLTLPFYLCEAVFARTWLIVAFFVLSEVMFSLFFLGDRLYK